MLQKTIAYKKGDKDDCLSEDDEIAVWANQQDLNISSTRLGRLISKANRKTYARLARKLISGMTSAQSVSGVALDEQFLLRFDTGNFDDKLSCTSDVLSTACFWSWVKEVQKIPAHCLAADDASRSEIDAASVAE